jgi:glutathione S-transferase
MHHDRFLRFNCVQRGHQNSLEGLPSFLALLLSAAIFYPAASAAAGAIYNIGAIRYMVRCSLTRPHAPAGSTHVVTHPPTHSPTHSSLPSAPGVQNGYSTGDPMKRMRGSIKYIGLLFLLGANVRAAVRLLLDV